MRRREDKAITKHTLNLYSGDYEKIQGWAGYQIGAAKVIRNLVHAYVKKVENDAAQRSKIDLVEDLGVSLESLKKEDENERIE